MLAAAGCLLTGLGSVCEPRAGQDRPGRSRTSQPGNTNPSHSLYFGIVTKSLEEAEAPKTHRKTGTTGLYPTEQGGLLQDPPSAVPRP